MDFGLPGPNPVLLLKAASYHLGEVFVKKALLNHMRTIQIHLLRLAFPLQPSAAKGTHGVVGNTIFYYVRVTYMEGPLGQEV